MNTDEQPIRRGPGRPRKHPLPLTVETLVPPTAPIIIEDVAPEPVVHSSLPIPALKREWLMFLGWSDAMEFLQTECHLRGIEAKRLIGGPAPKLRMHNGTSGFKRWHLKTFMDFRENLWLNKIEGNGEG